MPTPPAATSPPPGSARGLPGLQLIDRCRGERTVGEVLGGLGLHAAEALPVVRRLVEQGILLPA